MSRGWIAVDLDGTLAHCDGWKGTRYIGEPIPRMVERVRQWIAEGETVRIFTARLGNHDWDINDVITPIEEWCEKHIGIKLPVTNVKDMKMKLLYDDRCRQVVKNEGRIVEGKV